MKGITVAPTRPNNELVAQATDRMEVEQDQEAKGAIIWKMAFMNILVRNRVIELKKYTATKQNIEADAKKNIRDLLLPHPYLSINVQVSKSAGNSPKVIQKYLMSPPPYFPTINGIINISPKKTKLIAKKAMDKSPTILLCCHNNLS